MQRFEAEDLRDWFNLLIERLEWASGKDLDRNRMRVICEELVGQNYPRSKAQLAEMWILRGWPARKGHLSTADFFPTAKELESIDYDPVRDLATTVHQARREGFVEGFAAGELSACKSHRDDDAHLELVRQTMDVVNYARRKAVVVARERALDELADRLEQKRRDLLRRERMLERRSHHPY